MARPFAVFDIDGTLIRWQLGHALTDELVKRGHFNKSGFEKVKQARMEWKRRAGESSYVEYEEALIDLITASITGIKVEDLKTACNAVMDKYKDQVYTYTRDLILELKSKNYLLFAISASQAEVVGMLAEYYGFDDYGGSLFETKDGYYTGEIDVLKSGRKPEYLKELVTKHCATWKGSMAIGDSEGDVPMLAAVERPLAFNPNKELFEHAKKSSWKVVLERKNVIYELEPQNGGYVLG